MKHISSKGKERKQKCFHQCGQTRIQIFQNIIRHMCHFTFNNRKGENKPSAKQDQQIATAKEGRLSQILCFNIDQEDLENRDQITQS